MITKVEVSGFKSLTDFVFTLNPGLNILVGPNGSGKTNIVSFFEFLAHLTEYEASEATSRAGGAGTIFRKVGDSYETRIHAKIAGSTVVRKSIRRVSEGGKKKKTPNYCMYEFDFTLLLTESRDSVLFEKQSFRYKLAEKFVPAEAIEKTKGPWGVHIDSKLTNEGKLDVTIPAFDYELANFPFYPVRNPSSPSALTEVSKVIADILSSNISLLAMLVRYNPELWVVAEDVRGGQTYNIIPSRVKVPEDSAKPVGISRDGSGLAATLYAMQRQSDTQALRSWFHPPRKGTSIVKNSLDVLKNYLTLVASSLDNIEVLNDTFDNRLRVSFLIKSGEYEAKVPLSFVSDGTLKWLALVTAALTNTSVFSIEEPENYLHPHMQSQIVAVLREILFKHERNAFTLMTTHSETLLNHCTPEEIVVVSMRNGRTVARRCDDAREISSEINSTGFGLGYYYVAGALQYD